MSKKIRPSLTAEQKKNLAYKRKKGVLIAVIIILALILATEVGVLIVNLIKQTGA